MTTAQQDNSIELKRQVTIRTLVTDHFRSKAQTEMAEELKMIDVQSQQLEATYQNSMQQLEKLAQQGQNVQKHVSQLSNEAQQRREQLATLKMQVSKQLSDLDRIENGKYVVTGMLENTVRVGVGDNLYEKLKNAEILIEDDLVKEIRG